MPKIISETIERWCCTDDDLFPPADAKRAYSRGPWAEVICRHCNQVFEYHAFTDAAGSRDWNYRPVLKALDNPTPVR